MDVDKETTVSSTVEEKPVASEETAVKEENTLTAAKSAEESEQVRSDKVEDAVAEKSEGKEAEDAKDVKENAKKEESDKQEEKVQSEGVDKVVEENLKTEGSDKQDSSQEAPKEAASAASEGDTESSKPSVEENQTDTSSVEVESKQKSVRQSSPKKQKSNVDEDKAVSYRGGDVVWVRITRLGWWPAVVMEKEDLPSDFGALHPTTLAVVKFFNEDEFEEISKLDRLQPYDCESKLNYIKAGMTKFLESQKRQAKSSQFDNFPISVEEAEKLTNGDVSLAKPEKYDSKKETPSERRTSRKRSATNEAKTGTMSPELSNGEGAETNGKKFKRETSLSLSEEENDSLNKDPKLHAQTESVVRNITKMHILTENCLNYLKTRVLDENPAERYAVFCQDERHKPLTTAPVGFFDGFPDLYYKVADYLKANLGKVKTLKTNQHERNFVYNVLLPEAVSYGISQEFSIPESEVNRFTIHGISELVAQENP